LITIEPKQRDVLIPDQIFLLASGKIEEDDGIESFSAR
jgi:hypothetical protein